VSAVAVCRDPRSLGSGPAHPFRTGRRFLAEGYGGHLFRIDLAAAAIFVLLFVTVAYALEAVS
jgi:hypothetical protein